MTSFLRHAILRRVLAGACASAALTALAACGSAPSPATPGTHHGAMPSVTAPTSPAAPPSASHGMDGMPDMPGMDHPAAGDGLSDAAGGYRLTSRDAHLPAGRPTTYRFTVRGPGGGAVTRFAVDQTRRMHFYAIRSDLTGFQHVHPAMAADGTWSAKLAALAPGSWRLFASFTPADGTGARPALVLSRTVTVPGAAHRTPLPAPAATARVDGYTVTVRGDLMAGMAHQLTVSVARAGRPVTDLQPYLGTYAHLTAFHEGDAAFAHLHPETATATEPAGGHGGPELAFHAELPAPGDWRLFLQFATAGTLHTAALTLHVG